MTSNVQYPPDQTAPKTFTVNVPTSPEFGQCERDAEVAYGNVPGSPQWPVLNPDPELP